MEWYILYFNQVVEGINSSTVAIKSELLKEELVCTTAKRPYNNGSKPLLKMVLNRL